MMSMIGPLTIDTYLPSFPAIEAEFGVSRSLLSQSLALYLLAFAFSTLLLGPLADSIGRRRVMLGTLLFYIGASIGCALANDYGSFLFFRLLQGAAAGGGLVAGRAIIRDVYNPQDAQKAMSQVMMMFGLAPAIAPIIGAWLHDAFGWHSVFYFLALYSGLVLALIGWRIHETLPPERRQSYHPVKVTRVYGHTLVHRRFQSLVFMVACYFCGIFLYVAGAPTVVYDFLQLGTADFTYLFIPMVEGMMSGAWISSRLAHHWPLERSLSLALAVTAIGTLVNVVQSIWLPASILSTALPLMIYTCGIGIAMPVMTVLSLDCFPHNRGAASAMQGFVQMMSTAAIASIVVPLLSSHPSHLALGQTALIGIALLLWWRIPAAKEAPAQP